VLARDSPCGITVPCQINNRKYCTHARLHSEHSQFQLAECDKEGHALTQVRQFVTATRHLTEKPVGCLLLFANRKRGRRQI
jgi:hypothetical protein